MKITEKQVRIGTIVSIPENNIFTGVIGRLNKMGVGMIFDKTELLYERVPLTKEFLYEYTNFETFIHNGEVRFTCLLGEYNKITIYDDMSYSIDDIRFNYAMCVMDDDILEYVDQLQDLYKALTKKELQFLIIDE